MDFEQKINQKLNQYPSLKRVVKRIYQKTMYTFCTKVKFEGNIVRVSPDDSEHEYFFGYYDKSPWDATGRYILCLKARDTWSDVAPKDSAEILLIDTQQNNKTIEIATTHAWNVQQGCMAQWLGPKFDQEIIYNDFRDNKFVSVILNVYTGSERVLKMPVYSVANDGSFALTLDFTRLHRMRPGYGYSNIEEKTKNEKIPNAPCIWKLNIKNNTVVPVFKYEDFVAFEPRKEMCGAEHKVNHIMISPNGERFMVLHRWRNGERKYSRLITANIDGTEMYNLSDDDMVSHCYWKDNQTIIAFENKNESGAGYYLMSDKTRKYRRLWPHISADGHPSYSPDKRLIVTDTYPNRKRIADIKVLNEDFNMVVARVFAPFKYDNDTRCDLHPRWSRDGRKICFDSVFEGHRGLYVISLDNIKFAYTDTIGTELKHPMQKRKRIKVLYLMTACKKTGPVQQTLNIIKNLDVEKFEPILITIYEEEADSRMADYLPYVSAHYFVKTSKQSIVLNKDYFLRRKIEEIQPDIIHTVGVFPDYAVSQIGKWKQIHTLRNYVYEDYPAKFGKIKGIILAWLQLKAATKSDKTVVCSESLSKIYREKLNLRFDYIRNGIDMDQFNLPTEKEKLEIRRELDIPEDAFVWVYTGQFIERKNVPFLLRNYVKKFGNDKHSYILLLGDGPDRGKLVNKYASNPHIDFRGNVSNVNHFLKACDAYISTSKSEGLPNGVLEAMATGLPVLISDIEQHKEIFEVDDKIGLLYCQKDEKDFCDKMEQMYCEKFVEAGKNARFSVCENFSSANMSRKYQEVYERIVGK